ncbi:DUF2851 family protein [Flavobacterium dankookense]|uniref:Uncharacterized protein DUF2851 n=1 Tax=Flavobacterium dankookense TaxID=706186 RepID=A0A4V3CRX0_9FLAO|nr:DUF2851 family protein [Flavobacterium dankookense]TDP58382.1 uncharacterized protein DUF2851 [Flavobacterium dankookense]
MKEDFLHYVWQYKKFDFSNLKTCAGDSVIIVNSGQYLQLAGPDFFNAQIILNEQKWAGNVEIHLKSSDWYLHQHENDTAYDNVILHVVWENDVPIFRKDNNEIPTLELKNYVYKEVLENYLKLKTQKSWIYCENQIKTIDDFALQNWQERLFFERLERKEIPILALLKETENDWEAVLFCMLAKNFGLNTNGEAFLKIAKSIPFSVIRKESFEIENLEAVLFGMSDLIPLEAEDNYAKDIQKRFDYCLQKYQFQKKINPQVQFFKHRPDNFPTIRLAQLAMLYNTYQNLFSKIMAITKTDDFYKLFDISVSNYWQTHYQFDKVSAKKKKKFSKSFIDLLIINTIVPIQFSYAKSQGKEITEVILNIMNSIQFEKNSIVEKFAFFGIKSQNAFETQSLLQLKNEYCNQGKCLNCAIGIQLLKN